MTFFAYFQVADFRKAYCVLVVHHTTLKYMNTEECYISLYVRLNLLCESQSVKGVLSFPWFVEEEEETLVSTT